MLSKVSRTFASLINSSTALLCIGLVALGVIISGTSVGNLAQAKFALPDSTTITVKHSRNEPVEISAIKANWQIVTPDQPFTVGGDWLQSLVVHLQNTSGKVITYIEVAVEFPKVNGVGAIPDLTLSSGSHPMFPPDARQMGISLSLPSKGSLDISTSGQVYTKHKMYLSANSHLKALITQVKLHTTLVAFDDDTAWYKGYPLRRDSNNPLRWNVVREQSSVGIGSFRNNVGMQAHQNIDSSPFKFTPINFLLPLTNNISRRAYVVCYDMNSAQGSPCGGGAGCWTITENIIEVTAGLHINSVLVDCHGECINYDWYDRISDNACPGLDG